MTVKLKSLEITRQVEGFKFEPEPLESGIEGIDYAIDGDNIEVLRIRDIDMMDGIDFLSESIVWTFKYYNKKDSVAMFKAFIKQMEDRFFEAN